MPPDERAPTQAPPVAAPRAFPPPDVTDPDGEAPRSYPLDRLLHAMQGRVTAGISPTALGLAFADWWLHLVNAPGKQAELVNKAARKWLRLSNYCWRALQSGPEAASKLPPAIEPLAGDRRFQAPEWQRLPYSILWQAFLFQQQWWHNATSGIAGVRPQNAAIVHFAMRQVLDAFSPSNFPWSNPEVSKVTQAEAGANLRRGFQNWTEDAERALLGRRPAGGDEFRVGREVAITSGRVVFRNRLIEVLHYAPATDHVHPEPVLILPAWIMKYYILDLSPANSLVRYLVERGHDVFMASWKNPGEAERNLGMQDYVEDGALAALEAVRAIVGERKVHAAGYCLGGTLLAIAAAKLAQDGRDWLRTATLFAAQTDFTEAGELTLFINPSQVAYLEDMMWDQGYLDTRQMAGAFQLLRSNDLVWSTMVRQYLLGRRAPMSDLMAWNADATRMPYRMHSEYLRQLFLDNDLAAGRYRHRDKALSLDDIRVPIFAVSTTRDHIAPWRSVYKIVWLSNAPVTFVLASGGHNAGIVAPPEAGNGREYRISTHGPEQPYLDADAWAERATRHDGSWWPAWAKWLQAYSGDPVVPPPVAAPERGYPDLGPAPGRYVLES